MSRPPPPPSPSEPPARRFSREIVAAVASGVSEDELTLRLTLMDASKIKRDRTIALSDVSFSPEGMRFLGVRVIEGGVRSSELVTGYVPEEPEAPPPAKSKAKKAASPKAPRKAAAPAAG
jgi:hypothetical protein